MRAKQQVKPIVAMAASRPTLSGSKLEEAIAGATRRGCMSPTMVLLTLVTARRLQIGFDLFEGEGGMSAPWERNSKEKVGVEPAVKGIAENGSDRRVVPGEQDLSSGRVHGEGHVLQRNRRGQPQALPHHTGSDNSERACDLRFTKTKGRGGSGDAGAVQMCSLSLSCSQPKSGVTKNPMAYMIGNAAMREELSEPYLKGEGVFSNT